MRRAAAKTAKKASYHHGDLRRALIDAALEWIANEGPGAVSLRELASRVGVSHAAPYRHFSSKEVLFAAVAEEGFKLFREALSAARDAAGLDPRARLMATGLAYVRFAVAHPGHFKVMFSHFGEPVEEVPKLADEGATAFKVLFDCVVEAQQAGILRAGDPLAHSLFCWSGVHGLSMLLIENCLEDVGVGKQIDQYAQMVSANLFDGLAAREK